MSNKPSWQIEKERARTHALAFVPPKSIFATKEDRDQFHVEQTKNCILSDFHALSDAIGKSAARAFLLDECIDPIIPKPHE